MYIEIGRGHAALQSCGGCSIKAVLFVMQAFDIASEENPSFVGEAVHRLLATTSEDHVLACTGNLQSMHLMPSSYSNSAAGADSTMVATS